MRPVQKLPSARGHHHDRAVRRSLPLQQSAVDGILPHREARAGGAPRIHHVGMGARLACNPFDQIEDQRLDILHAGVLISASRTAQAEVLRAAAGPGHDARMGKLGLVTLCLIASSRPHSRTPAKAGQADSSPVSRIRSSVPITWWRWWRSGYGAHSSGRPRSGCLPIVFPLVMAFGGVLGILGVPLSRRSRRGLRHRPSSSA